ncbi:MAG: hypothetical protein KKH21_22155 [Gammaproteobacteria bacterium]|nr:hypothetical protein [Gammaproteobacteria bacterium]MBU1816755.1 hypothetical protein [Gammaproteobacteria bacterium]
MLSDTHAPDHPAPPVCPVKDTPAVYEKESCAIVVVTVAAWAAPPIPNHTLEATTLQPTAAARDRNAFKQNTIDTSEK